MRFPGVFRPNSGTVLRSRRVELRPLLPTDYEQWDEVRTRCGEWLTKWEPTPPGGTGEITEDRFSYRCSVRDRDWQAGIGYGFGIFVHGTMEIIDPLLDGHPQSLGDREGDLAPVVVRGRSVRPEDRPVFVGELNLSDVIRGPMQSAHAGYWIDRAFAGNGIMPEAVALLGLFVFESLRLHRMQISIVPRNLASRRVVEKLNLREEGTSLRYLEINGVWEDHIHYAITSEEWAERRNWFVGNWALKA